MHKLTALTAALALATGAIAQSPYVVVPQGMETSYAGNTGLTWRNTAFRYQMIYDTTHFLDQGIDYPITMTRLAARTS